MGWSFITACPAEAVLSAHSTLNVGRASSGTGQQTGGRVVISLREMSLTLVRVRACWGSALDPLITTERDGYFGGG